MSYGYVARTSFAGYKRGDMLSAADAAIYGNDPSLTIRVAAPPAVVSVSDTVQSTGTVSAGGTVSSGGTITNTGT